MQPPNFTESHWLSYKGKTLIFFEPIFLLSALRAYRIFRIMEPLAVFTIRLVLPSLKLMVTRRVLITSRIVSDRAVEKRKTRNIVNFISVPLSLPAPVSPDELLRGRVHDLHAFLLIAYFAAIQNFRTTNKSVDLKVRRQKGNTELQADSVWCQDVERSARDWCYTEKGGHRLSPLMV